VSPVIRLCVQCATPVPPGQTRCPKHQAERNAVVRVRKDAQHKIKGYGTTHWKRVRRQHLELDGYACQIRLPLCLGIADTVDLHPALNGNHRIATVETTRSACRRCHGATDGGRRTGAASHYGREWTAAFNRGDNA
jgi:5-methylcytosine-specific restriction endonuclease McrA